MDWIQLRSDTQTIPTQQIKQAILNSSYGDWTYGEDETVVELERYCAELFGKEAGAYVATGVFGNQCALLTAGGPGQEMIIRDQGHIIEHQNGSVGAISRMMTRTLEPPQGYLTPQIIKSSLRKKKDWQSPKISILVLEFPTLQGLVPPPAEFDECARLGKQEGLHVHVDGARFFNALAEVPSSPAQVVKNCSSVMFCFSKGLCAPVGSMVVGSASFITAFKKNRKMMGGVLRKPGVVAGAALAALKSRGNQLTKDNQIARSLSSKMVDLGWFELTVPVQTNMISVKITDPSIDGKQMVEFMRKNGVLLAFNGPSGRIVTHRYVREQHVERTIQLLREFRKQAQDITK